jgi:catalase
VTVLVGRPRDHSSRSRLISTGQNFIPTNQAAYSPNTLNNGFPAQANQATGKGFFTSPTRYANGNLVREVSPTFADVWSQPRLFYNSLTPTEQQFIVNGFRFEVANVQSEVVKQNFITQINRVDNDLAARVARVIGVPVPQPDSKFYNNNKTSNVGTFGTPLMKIDGLKVGVLASVKNNNSISQGKALASALASSNVDVVVVGEFLGNGIDATYSQSDATAFDAVIVAAGAEGLFSPASFTASVKTSTALYPAGRPIEILVDAFRFGKPVGAVGSASAALKTADIGLNRTGVYTAGSVSGAFVNNVKSGLATFKFLDRFALDN